MAIITYWLGIEGLSRRNTIAFIDVGIPTEKEKVLFVSIAQKIKIKMQQELLFCNIQKSYSLVLFYWQ